MIIQKSLWFFKQTIILMSITLMLLTFSIFLNVGALGVIIGIRTIFMARTEYKKWNNTLLSIDGRYLIIINEFSSLYLDHDQILKFETTQHKIFRYHTTTITFRINDGVLSTIKIPYLIYPRDTELKDLFFLK